MKNLILILLLFGLFSCTERDNQEFVETGLDFAKEIEKLPPNLKLIHSALATELPQAFRDRSVEWIPEITEDFGVECTSIGPCIDFKWKIKGNLITQGKLSTAVNDTVDIPFNSEDFIAEENLRNGYYYTLVVQARSQDGIFLEIVKKFVVGYPDPITPYVPDPLNPDELIVLETSDEMVIRDSVPQNITYKCNDIDEFFFCSLITGVKIQHAPYQNTDEAIQIDLDNLRGDGGDEISTGAPPDNFTSDFEVIKTITYKGSREHESSPIEIEFKNELTSQVNREV